MSATPAEVTAEEVGRHRGGRHLDPSRDDALRRAAMELLAEVGYDRLTMDEVAARAHAGKTTIYRRWPSKAELVVDALRCAKGSPEFPDTGSLRGDLAAVIKRMTSADNRFDARVTIGVVNAVTRDDELRRVFRERVFGPRMAGMRAVFERAVARGEMPDGHDFDLLASVFHALAMHYLLTHGQMPKTAFAQRIVDHVLLPLATSAPAQKPTSQRKKESTARE